MSRLRNDGEVDERYMLPEEQYDFNQRIKVLLKKIDQATSSIFYICQKCGRTVKHERVSRDRRKTCKVCGGNMVRKAKD